MPRILRFLTVLLLSTPAVIQAQQSVNTWSDVFALAGVDNTVTALAESNGRIYVGGHFQYAGSEFTNFAAYDAIAENWIALADVAGAIKAMAVTEDGLIYVGGAFSMIGGISASAIALYDPQSDEWSGLGGGITGEVTSLSIGPLGDLYAGGWFNSAGGESAQNIARWDGTEWDGLGGVGIQGGVTSLAFSGDVLYVAGRFDSAGGIETKNVATYNTATMTWSTLGGGVDSVVLPVVDGLAISDSGVYVGGILSIAHQPDGSTLPINNVARWDLIEEQWFALGEGSGFVEGMGVGPDGMLYVNGGIFDDTNLGVLHRWDGEEWQGVIPVESGFNAGRVAQAFLTTDNRLIVGFQLFFLEGAGGPKQALYWYEPDTDGWGVFGGPDTNGMTENVYALSAAPNGTVYAGGWFRYAGSTEANHVAYWNGTFWEALGGGLRLTNLIEWPRVNALHYGNDDMVYVGGDFHDVIQIDGTAVPSRRIAAWDPAAGIWQALGRGVNSYVEALAQLPDGTVYVGGQFTQAIQAGGEALDVPRLVVWNTATGQWELPLGQYDFNMIVSSMAVDISGALFVAGVDASGGRVMRLDPQTEEWMELRVWPGRIVRDIAVSGNPLDDGVLFAALDPGSVWQWRSGSWSELEGFSRALSLALNGNPYSGGELYAGGWSSEPTWQGIRRMRGAGWEDLGEGILSPSIYTLAVGPSETEDQAAVWVGGEFMMAGGMPSVCIARWETVDLGWTRTETPPSEQGITLQVYPNPAIDRLTLAYEFEAATSVRVVLYDLLGREVAVFHDGILAAGSGTLTSDVKHLPSGMYIVRMMADDRNSSVQRLTIVR